MIWLFTSRFGVIGAALAWLPAILFVQILCLYFIQDIFHNPLKEVRKPLLAILLGTIAGASVSYIAISMLPNIPGLIIAGLLAALVTGSILWFSDRRYSLGLVRNIAVAFPQVASILKIRNTDVS
jgi:O-antigen/teichoic acid export membrane protein